jgi:predicted 3-demethylubiquinone-9 3-methyltransferase (glyoxalase superfamily)
MATKKRKTSRAPARKGPRKILKARTPQKPISPCLWFAGNGEDAARFYVSVFKSSKLGPITRYPAVGQEVHGQPAGSVMTVEFTLNGVDFLALNGGPLFKFNEAISLQVFCRDQKEVDYYWDRLGEGGDPRAQVCGWLKDKYGLSWQIVPEGMSRIMASKGPGRDRAFAAMMEMKKIDIAAIEAAYKGK